MPEKQPESILLLAAEGGGFHFFRQQQSDGTSSFSVKTYGCGFDVADCEQEFANSPSNAAIAESFATLEEAVQSSFPNGVWVLFQLLEIHPDVEEAMWRLRERTIQSHGALLEASAVWLSTRCHKP